MNKTFSSKRRRDSKIYAKTWAKKNLKQKSKLWSLRILLAAAENQQLRIQKISKTNPVQKNANKKGHKASPT